MKLNWGVWLIGLLAAVIQGGAGAVTAAIGASWVAPDKFNVGSGLHDIVVLMGVVFFVNAALGFFSYLAKHPTPEWDGVSDRRGASGITQAAGTGK